MSPQRTEIRSITQIRSEALLTQLKLHELGLAAMGLTEVQQAEELRNQQLAQVGLQSA